MSIEPTGQLVVLKTPAGYATPLADAIDAAVLGDIAGQRSPGRTRSSSRRGRASGKDVAELLRHHLEGDGA